MAIPDLETAQIYKSPTIVSQIRAAIELDYPVFSGAFVDDFADAALDTDKWFSWVPSWGAITVAGGTVTLSVTDADGGIAPPWIQSRHNLAFPVRRDTNWQFDIRCRFPVMTGFGVFVRICGTSFRDAEAIWALKANTTSGLQLHTPDGFTADNVIWSTADGAPWRRYRVSYDASEQVYICSIDQNDDGTYETVVNVPVVGRYAEAIVIGNSTAIQGALGTWTSLEVDSVSITGTAETVVDPEWVAPFTYDGTRFAYLPTLHGGRVSIDKDNMIDAAEISLTNRGLNEEAGEDWQLYTAMRFWNRRALIEGRAGDGNGLWAPWEILFDAKCAEKIVTIEGGECNLSIPMRDRYRAVADDVQVLGCYSDAETAIPGVGMNMTVAEIAEDILRNRCGLPPAAMAITATPYNKPRTYNIFRQSGLQAVRTVCEQAALALYQDRKTAQIVIDEWDWGTSSPRYQMSTAQDIYAIEWTESAFDVISGQQLSFENTNLGGIIFQCTWPPHRQPFYGRVDQDNAIVCQASGEHDARPVNALMWWAKNRRLGSIEIETLAQFWLDHNDEILITDDRFMGIRDAFIVDGWEIDWHAEETAHVRIRLINPRIDEFLRNNLMP